MKKYISVGITGGIGSGKTFVCEILEAMGYPVFYSDQVAKEIISSSSEAIAQIKNLFGENAYKGDELNRAYLAELIFNDPSLREKMNAIVHPLVRQAFEEWAGHQNSKLVFNEAAILFETGSYQNFDFTILVTAPKQLRIQRVQKRDDLSKEEIEKRMSAQWSDDKKRELANFVINNDEQEMLLPQINEILTSIL